MSQVVQELARGDRLSQDVTPAQKKQGVPRKGVEVYLERQERNKGVVAWNVRPAAIPTVQRRPGEAGPVECVVDLLGFTKPLT